MSDEDESEDINGADDSLSFTGDTGPFLPKPTLDALNALFRTGGAFDPQINKSFQSAFNPSLKKALQSAVEPEIIKAWRSQLSSISKNLAAGAALNYPSYKTTSVKSRTAYSPDMNGPGDYFQPWEGVIGSFAELQEAVARISQHHPGTTFLWRGQQGAEWPLHSSLFRQAWKAKGVRDPSQTHRESEPFPTDQDMNEAEGRILSYIRDHWGFEDASALSTFARLQHFGAPTRFLDVSRNPLIAAWFATEKHSNTDIEDYDCRLFALAATRVAANPEQHKEDMRVSRIDVATAAAVEPFWHRPWEGSDDQDSGFGEWGTGRIRRFWIPPHYESRIAAQNAAFILDGVPVKSPDLSRYYPKGNGRDGLWSLADRLAASSISVRFSRPNRAVGSRIAATLPPSFTFRIKADAKYEIRQTLEERYSYSKSTIYPDIQGAAQAIRDDLFELLEDL